MEKNHIDIALLIAVIALMLLGLGVVYSASATWAYYKFGESEHLLNSHALKILLGMAALFVGIRVDYHRLQKFTKPALLIAVVMLLATLLTGGEVKGAARWFRFGGYGFQTSEFAKFALVFHLSALIASKGESIRDFKKGFIPMMIWVGSVTVLVLLQPNFSTGAMILLLSLVMLFIGRVRVSHLVLTLFALLPLLALYLVSAEYRLKRVEAFLSGESSSGKTNYQLFQGIIGFGNGGLFGVGPGQSRQRDLFLPESYGDFVFSIVGEEYGFIGTLVFLGLFLIIMMRGMKIAKFARDEFGFYLATGITTAITLYTVINVGVALGILPTTGLPMPFVSYGGSSIFFSAFVVGIVLNISAHTDLHPRAIQVPVVGTVNASGDDLRTRTQPAVGKIYS